MPGCIVSEPRAARRKLFCFPQLQWPPLKGRCSLGRMSQNMTVAKVAGSLFMVKAELPGLSNCEELNSISQAKCTMWPSFLTVRTNFVRVTVDKLTYCFSKTTLVCRLELLESLSIDSNSVIGGSKIILKYAGKDATFVRTPIVTILTYLSYISQEYEPIHPPDAITANLPIEKQCVWLSSLFIVCLILHWVVWAV